MNRHLVAPSTRLTLVALLLAFVPFTAAAGAPHGDPGASVLSVRQRQPTDRLRFTVAITSELAAGGPVSGRLFVFLSRDTKAAEILGPDFMDPSVTYATAIEVRNLLPGATVAVDPDVLSVPEPFSKAPAGDYRVQALLDVDHSYAYNGPGSGDLCSEIAAASALDPSAAEPIALTLSKRLDKPGPVSTDTIKLVTFESPALTAFWGRTITMRAGVVLPPSYATAPKLRYPTVYMVHGYGGSHGAAWTHGATLQKQMADGSLPEMIFVYLDGSCPMGHHEFADSANNGPWGRALTAELIPHLEKQFRMDGVPKGRFLNGHSSGGWSTLWLQVTYPDFFGGTWSTSPDPVDLRSFTGVDTTKPATENFYRTVDGTERNLVRHQGRNVLTMRQYVQLERVSGDYGGQMESFEAVWSPKGEDGRPMPFFDRDTGAIDPVVAKAWERYDIARILETNWARLGPKLKGKIYVAVGSADTFHLDESTILLRDRLAKLGSDARFVIVPGRSHFDLFQPGFFEGMVKEMYARARPAAKAAGRK